jgi:hypothetical protein
MHPMSMPSAPAPSHLDRLEAESIQIFREVAADLRTPGLA